MKVAVVGSGIAGMMAARLLHRSHDVTLFEADRRPGGHAHTVDVEVSGRTIPVDTGFLVHCESSYPVFTRLLAELDVATRPADMSFSVSREPGGLEYCGTSLDALFAQRRNLLRPSFLRMVRDILRFFREAPELLDDDASDLSLGEYLARGRYSRAFVDDHLVPLGSAIWSARPDALLEFPARFFVRFFLRQGFLQARERPPWRTLVGGSREYVGRLLAPLGPALRLSCPVHRIRRLEGAVEIVAGDRPAELFDHVFLALHSDQALRVLADPTPAERDVLGALAYESNEAVLHLDETLLPRSRRAWAAWNYHLPVGDDGRAAVTYDITRLQSLPTSERVCVTLNRTDRIDPARIVRRFTYHHPIFGREAVAAQGRRAEISGVRRTHYCGAYWGYGFHEDGARSAVEAVQDFEEETHRAERAVSRLGAA